MTHHRYTKFDFFEQPNLGLEHYAGNIKDLDLQNWDKCMCSCKERVWSRRIKEYPIDLWELHNLQYNSKETSLKERSVTIIRGNAKNRAHWRTGIFHEPLPEHSNITRAVKLRAGKFCLQRTVQHFSTLFNTVSTQRRCDQKQTKEANKIELSVTATEFQPQRNAAAIAVVKMIEEMEDYHEAPTIK